MPRLTLKPSHKAVRDYYATLQQYDKHDITHEGAVSNPFAFLLDACAKQMNATLVPQYPMRAPKGNRIVIDGAIIDEYGLPLAYWEAKDIDDDLSRSVQEKREAGYPLDNILFQTPQRAILYQNGREALDLDITEPANLIAALQYLFAYVPPALENWQTAVTDFREHVPDLANKLKELIEQRHETDPAFKKAFTDFYEICRTSINPELSQDAVEEMLIQHILTERIFRTVFNRSDFTSRNIIAVEIEKIGFILPLSRPRRSAKTSPKNSTSSIRFTRSSSKGFSEDVADTHGIVYTPQPIVDFMVKSVAHILETEFGRSLSDTGVHIIDPFVGTGNFIVRLMQDIQGTALEAKYRHELHCNEVMLLPYYIASLNIEQEFFQRTGTYLPFEGIALADTFELLEQQQTEFFTQENTRTGGETEGGGYVRGHRQPTLQHGAGDSQCFPFYTYDEDGTNRQENITDWALAEFRTHYADDTITKWDIFHYNYGLLHHPTYREKYEANLKRDLPHIPFAEDFGDSPTQARR
ncbi:hypothetical protein GBAR_LOCUS26116 [Geodia barretti]|uniref:DNA methylase adenine-specific domain-containing protein n=1 Tax=Geodia barretti TaxID=519541 RepID=A0AA35THN9_GEOBA|nr:hypothetical protein GBAR_LOCUS26116 [Geodia barretti]